MRVHGARFHNPRRDRYPDEVTTLELRCPRCAQNLEAYQRPVGSGPETVSADMCMECGGVWHDGPEVSVVYPEIAEMIAYVRDHAGISQLDCPVCAVGMGGFMVERIALDVCRSCSGLWIDGKEVLALEAARPAMAGAAEQLSARAGYRNAARVPGDAAEATILCPGCGKEVAKARMRRTSDGERCQLCVEVETEPISMPPGLFGRALAALRNVLSPACPECGEHVCPHRMTGR